jgi:cell division cycle 14
MQYIPFAKDFGPFNLAFTFDACCTLYEEQHVSFEDSRFEQADEQPGPGGPLCLYTSPDPKIKANTALMVALYCVSWRR